MENLWETWLFFLPHVWSSSKHSFNNRMVVSFQNDVLIHLLFFVLVVFGWHFVVFLLGFLLRLVKSSQFLLILFSWIWNSASISKVFWVLLLFWIFLLCFLLVIRIFFFLSFLNNFCLFVLYDWSQIRSSINCFANLRIRRKNLWTWLSLVIQKSSVRSFSFNNLSTSCLIFLITQGKHFGIIWLPYFSIIFQLGWFFERLVFKILLFD